MIGEKILKLRKSKNLSQEELAEQINVTRQTISNWELGETIPDLKQAKVLAKVFDTSVDELINNDNLSKKVDETINSTNKILKIVKTILIILVIIIIIALLVGIFIFESLDYFEATPSGSSVIATCTYNNEPTTYEVHKDYQSGNISLITTNQEILTKFKPYDYINEQKMLDDITNYIENNGGTCDNNLSSK